MENSDKTVFVRGRVPESVRARFKAACAYLGRDMNAILLELIEGWLQENEQAAVEKRTQKKLKTEGDPRTTPESF